jgi:DNA-binding response OmpR family regulator
MQAEIRQDQAEADIFDFNGKTIDFNTLEHQGKAVSRKSMLEEVWGVREDTDTRAIDNFIVRLRKYIEPEPAKPRHLVTVRGVGYRFIPKPD